MKRGVGLTGENDDVSQLVLPPIPMRTVAELNIRQAPGRDSPVLATFKAGVTVAARVLRSLDAERLGRRQGSVTDRWRLARRALGSGGVVWLGAWGLPGERGPRLNSPWGINR